MIPNHSENIALPAPQMCAELFDSVQLPLKNGTETAGTPMENVRWKTAYEYGSRSGVVLGYTSDEEGHDLVRFRADDGEIIDLLPHELFPETSAYEVADPQFEVEVKKNIPATGDLVAWTAGSHQLVGELLSVNGDVASIARLVSGSGKKPDLKTVPVARLRLATANGAEAIALEAHHKHSAQQQQWLAYHDKQFESYIESSSPDVSYTKDFTLTSEATLRKGKAHVVPDGLIRSGGGQVYVARIENRFGKVVELRGYRVEPEASWSFITRQSVPGQIPKYGTVIQGQDGKSYVIRNQHTWKVMSQLSAGERVRVKATGAEDVIKGDSSRRNHGSVVYALQGGGGVQSVEVERIDVEGDQVITQCEEIEPSMSTETLLSQNIGGAKIDGQPKWVNRLIPEIDALKIEYQTRYNTESAALSKKEQREGVRPATNPNIWGFLAGVSEDLQTGNVDDAVETLGTMVGMGRGIGSWVGGDAYSKIRALITGIRAETTNKSPHAPNDVESAAGCEALHKVRYLRLEDMGANEALRNEGLWFSRGFRLDLVRIDIEDARRELRREQYAVFLRDGELFVRQWNVTDGFHDRKVIYTGDDPFNRRPVSDLRAELQGLEQKARIVAQSRLHAEVADSKRNTKASERRYGALLAEEIEKRRGQLDDVTRRLELAQGAYDRAMEKASPQIKNSHEEQTAKLLEDFPLGTRVKVKSYRTIGDYNNFSNRTGVVERGHWDGWYVRLDMRPRERSQKVVLILQSNGLERFEGRIKPAPGPIETITLPLEEFEKASSACYALMKLSEQQVKNGIATPVSVPAIRINGILVTGMGGCHHGLDSQFDAWEMTPEETYQGPTTARYHDEEAINAGLRDRGDHTGLVVTYRGSRMVLTRRIAIMSGAPSLQYSVSLEDAKAYDAKPGQGYWRSESGDPIRWIEKAGFVFAVFPEKHGKELTMLYCKNEHGSIRSVYVKDVDSFSGPRSDTGTIDVPKAITRTAKPRRDKAAEDMVMKKLIEALRALS